MNIFFLSENPYEAARFMVDRHSAYGKMICESASMLANCFSDKQLALAPPTQTGKIRGWSWYNHPCSKWVRESYNNYLWLLDHAFALIVERYHRTGKGHYTTPFINWCSNNQPVNINGSGKLTYPALAMPDYCKKDCPVESYRNYYNKEKRHLFSWTKRDIPNFIEY